MYALIAMSFSLQLLQCMLKTSKLGFLLDLWISTKYVFNWNEIISLSSLQPLPDVLLSVLHMYPPQVDNHFLLLLLHLSVYLSMYTQIHEYNLLSLFAVYLHNFHSSYKNMLLNIYVLIYFCSFPCYWSLILFLEDAILPGDSLKEFWALELGLFLIFRLSE